MTMNVKQLIDKLGEYPAETRVVVQGYEDGFDDVDAACVERRQVRLNVGKHDWAGDHMEFDPRFDREHVDDVIENVVSIRRRRR